MTRNINKLEKFLQTDKGKRLLNYAYSFGAAIVIFGALVKVLHIWGIWGNIIFGVGMLTEVIVFILYGFDTPENGMQTQTPANAFRESASNISVNLSGTEDMGNDGQPIVVNVTGNSGAGGYQGSPQPQVIYQGGAPTQAESGKSQSLPLQEQPIPSSGSGSNVHIDAGDHVGQLSSVSQNVQKFAEATDTLTKISESLQASYQHIVDNSQNISQNSLGYVQQMEALNRNIAGLNTIYEIQLKGISGQIDTLDHINSGLNRIKNMYDNSVPDSAVFRSETEKMTQQIKELNQVYARLLQAMTVNMPNNPAPPTP